MNLIRVFTPAAILGVLAASGGVFAAEGSSTTQTVSGGGVTAKATLLTPQDNDEIRFQLVLDTHPVNLDRDDLKSIAVFT